MTRLIAAARRLLEVIAEPNDIVRDHWMDNALQEMADAIDEAGKSTCIRCPACDSRMLDMDDDYFGCTECSYWGRYIRDIQDWHPRPTDDRAIEFPRKATREERVANIKECIRYCEEKARCSASSQPGS
jgi:hypothetical protein